MRNEKEKKEHAYVVIEVEKCHESLREEGDPECASDID